MKTANKTVLITGGTKGIGKAIAIEFLKNGYEVVLNYSSDDSAAYETQEELNMLGYCPVVLEKADISCESAVMDMFDDVLANFGKIDVLVNNAGIDYHNIIQKTTLEKWNRVFAVNMTGAFLCSRCAVSSMVRNQSGAIINVASIWGEVGASCEVAYSASKGALIAFTKALAKELAPSKISVNCVSPGVIDTQMNSNLSETELQSLIDEIPFECLGTGEDVAKAVLFLAESSYITGEVLSVGGGFAK